MGTSVEVYPRTTAVPTFAEVQEKAAELLSGFFAKFDLGRVPAVNAHWRQGPSILRSVDPGEPFAWHDDRVCAWFTLSNVSGGTDAYFREDVPGTQRHLKNELESDGRFQAREAELLACMQIGRRWTFCRWGGAVATTNIAYGILAASVAALTDGMTHSADCAWDHERFPATAAEFLSWWYDPEQALSVAYRDWARKCVAAVRAGLENPNEA